MVPETWESFVELPHDATWTMEQVSSELCVHGSTSVGWHSPAAPKLSVGVDSIKSPEPRLVSKSGSDGARDLGKLCRAAS